MYNKIIHDDDKYDTLKCNFVIVKKVEIEEI